MGKPYFGTVDIALIGILCALWVILNLTIGPMGFMWFGLPIFCDFAVFFTLLLATWTTGKFGIASIVGVIGSIIIFFARASPYVIGFAASAMLFDALMLTTHHKIDGKAYNIIIASFATTLSAYSAGAIIGVFFSGNPLNQATLEWATTFWGGLNVIGGIMSLAITLPIIGILEKANVRKIKSD